MGHGASTADGRSCPPDEAKSDPPDRPMSKIDVDKTTTYSMDAKHLPTEEKHGGGVGNTTGISSAKLKKMALGQPGYKDVQRHYDPTLSSIEFNNPSSIQWSPDVPTESVLGSTKPIVAPQPINPRGPPPRGSVNSSIVPRPQQQPPRPSVTLPAIAINAAGHPAPSPINSSYAGALAVPVAVNSGIISGSGHPIVKALPPRRVVGGAHPLGPVGTYPVMAPSSLPAPTAPIDTPPILKHQEPRSSFQTQVEPSPLNSHRAPMDQPSIRGTSVGVKSSPQAMSIKPQEASKRGDDNSNVHVDEDEDDENENPGDDIYDWLADQSNQPAKANDSNAKMASIPSLYGSNHSNISTNRRGSGGSNSSSNGNIVVTDAQTHAVQSEIPGEPPKRIPVKPFPGGAPMKRLDSEEAFFSFVSPTPSGPVNSSEPSKPFSIPSLSLSLVATPQSSTPSYVVAGEGPSRFPGGVAPSNLSGSKSWQKFLPPSSQNSTSTAPTTAQNSQLIPNVGSMQSTGGRVSILPNILNESQTSTAGGKNVMTTGEAMGTGGAPPRQMPGRGLPPATAPKPSASPHAVKETTDVKRNRAQLPTVMTHAKPTTGDWLKKRYIVNNYILLDTLGEGSYGEVRMCKERVSDEIFAIKIISKDMLNKKKNGKTSETYFEDIKREIAIMKKLLHPNVLRLFEVLDDPKINKLYLVLEYMKQGDLMQFLKDRESQQNGSSNAFSSASSSDSQGTYTLLTDVEYWNIFRQVTAGVRYLHFQNVVHGDIKPQNLLVSEDGVVKIADFGISKMMSTSSNAVQDAAGTPAFMSPELWEMHQGDSVSGPLADVWALGGTMFMLRFGHPPFIANNIVLLGNKIRHDPLVFPLPIDNGLRDLLENMLVKDPNKRFTLEKVLMHPYLRHPPTIPGRQVVSRAAPQPPPGQQQLAPGQSLNRSAKTPAKYTAIDFKPPDSYHQQEQAAMSLFVNNVSQKDIFASIGGVNKRKGKSGKGNSSASLSAKVTEEDSKGQEDIMITGWGGDVFEHVDDVEIDSDIDDDMDEVDEIDGAGAERGAADRINRPEPDELESAKKQLFTGDSIDKSFMGSDSSFQSTGANSKPDMTVEEEQRRLKRFQQLQTKKSFDYSKAEELSMKSSMTKHRSSGFSSVSEVSEQSSESFGQFNNVKSPSHDGLSRVGSEINAVNGTPSSKGRKSKKSCATPSNDGNDEEEEETESVDMEGFAKMMDTLALQPKRLGVEMETALTTIDLTETVVSTQYMNDLNGVKGALYSERGPRPTQEDRCVLLPDMSAMKGLADYDFGDDGRSKQMLSKFSVGGVFDGHSGWRTSEYLCQNFCPMLAVHPKLLDKHIDQAISETFAEMEKEVCAMLSEEDDSSGSTAILAIYDGRRNVFTVASVGDSMCVLSRGGKAVPMLPMHRLTNESERKRVVSSGGSIINNRINGILALSRAMGDIQFKDPSQGQVVIAVPEIFSEVITPMTELAIIATDGVWDVMSPQAAVNFARQKLAEQSGEVDMREVAKCIVKEALALGSIDNVTVLVLTFHL